jgi:hypothetical protein
MFCAANVDVEIKANELLLEHGDFSMVLPLIRVASGSES